MLTTPRVTLVSLPWTTLTEPSLGLGILRAVLVQAGIPVRVRHISLEMTRWLRAGTYVALANVYALNDFIFSGTLDPHVTTTQLRWLREKTYELLLPELIDVNLHGGIDGVMDKILALRRNIVPGWLEEIADSIAHERPTLVGFTCMFDQTVASIALARLVKDRAPDTLIALGGYAVRSPAAETVLRAFPWIDAVCAGEGDQVIVPLAEASSDRRPLSSVRGLVVRAGADVTTTEQVPAAQMDDIPDPDYDDFFVDLADLAENHQVDVSVTRLPIENSRGCWWGARHHCVFCGIHDDDLVYRARSAARVVTSMEALSSRYGIHRFRFADYILPHQYHETLVPELIARGAPWEITCEIKANLTPNKVERLAAAGFKAVQPGIESFSSAVLERMDKGVRAIQNVHTLLLGQRHGVHIDYNLLYGMPGDVEADYITMLAQLPRLFHLDPPATRIQIQITRYAPLQIRPESFGLTPSGHDPAYDLVWSRDYLITSGFDLDAYCYYFERTTENPPRLERLFRRIDAVVDTWKAQAQSRPVMLTSRPTLSGLAIQDTRGPKPREYDLDSDASALLEACTEPTTESSLVTRFPNAPAILKHLDDLGLVFREQGKVLSLVLRERV